MWLYRALFPLNAYSMSGLARQNQIPRKQQASCLWSGQPEGAQHGRGQHFFLGTSITVSPQFELSHGVPVPNELEGGWGVDAGEHTH